MSTVLLMYTKVSNVVGCVLSSIKIVYNLGPSDSGLRRRVSSRIWWGDLRADTAFRVDTDSQDGAFVCSYKFSKVRCRHTTLREGFLFVIRTPEPDCSSMSITLLNKGTFHSLVVTTRSVFF